MSQPPEGQAQTSRGQHHPLAKGEPHFDQNQILEITSSPPSKKKSGVWGGVGMILTMWMIQYSFWKLKGPNSSSTGVHVGREGA